MGILRNNQKELLETGENMLEMKNASARMNTRKDHDSKLRAEFLKVSDNVSIQTSKLKSKHKKTR